MSAPGNSSGESGSERPVDGVEQGREWIAQALVRLGHPGLVDRALDPEARGPIPSPGRGTLVEMLRLRRDSLKYQLNAVSTLIATYVIVSLVLGLGADAGHLAPIGIVFGAIGIYGIAAIDDAEDAAMVFVFEVLLVWFTALVILVVHDWVSAVWAYAVPAIVVVVLVWVLPTRFPLRDEYDIVLSLRGVVRSAPLLGPVLLGLFAIALFNASLWEAANELNVVRIALALALTIGPILLVVRARIRGRFEQVLKDGARNLTFRSLDKRSSLLVREITLAVRDATPEAIERCAGEVMRDHWPAQAASCASELDQSERKILLAPVTMRLLFTVLLVGSLVLAFVYVFAWIAVPTNLAKHWITHGAAVAHLNVLAIHATVPGAPYFLVAVLLSLIATAAFLGSAALDERVARPLTDAILGEPVRRLLILALPYREMIRDAKESAVTGT